MCSSGSYLPNPHTIPLWTLIPKDLSPVLMNPCPFGGRIVTVFEKKSMIFCLKALHHLCNTKTTSSSYNQTVQGIPDVSCTRTSWLKAVRSLEKQLCKRKSFPCSRIIWSLHSLWCWGWSMQRHHPCPHHQDHPRIIPAFSWAQAQHKAHTAAAPAQPWPQERWENLPSPELLRAHPPGTGSKAEIMAWHSSPELLLQHFTVLWHHHGMLNTCTATRASPFKFQQNSPVTFGNTAKGNKSWCPHGEPWQDLFMCQGLDKCSCCLRKTSRQTKKPANLQQSSHRARFRHWAGKAEVLLSTNPVEQKSDHSPEHRSGTPAWHQEHFGKFIFSIKNYTSPEAELFWCPGTIWTSDVALK